MNTCVECDGYFFDDDLICQYESESDDIEEINNVVDYSVFVLNNNNLQRELANILILDSSEKPNSLARRIDNLVSLYDSIENSQQTTNGLNSVVRYIKPLVKITKFIDNETVKPVIRVLYDVDNYIQEDVDDFCTKFLTAPIGTAFTPFQTNSQKHQMVSSSNFDTLHMFNSHDKNEFQTIRINANDIVNIVGLVNLENATYDDPPTVYNVDEYISLVQSLQVGDSVFVKLHSHIINVKDGHGTVVAIDNNIISIRLANDETVSLDKSKMFTSDFCITKNANTFTKYNFFTKPSIVISSNITTLQSLLPTPSEWLYTHPNNALNIFSYHDVGKVFDNPDSIKNIERVVRPYITKNLSVVKSRLRERPPLKLVRKIYKEKHWPRVLQLNGFPHNKSSLDTSFSRMLYLTHGKRLYRQCLECIIDDIDSEAHTGPDVINNVVDNNLESIVTQLETKIKNTKLQVFSSLDDTYNAPVLDKHGCIWNKKTCMFAMLSPYHYKQLDMWTIDFESTRHFISSISSATYNKDTLTIGSTTMPKHILSHMSLESHIHGQQQKPQRRAVQHAMQKTNQIIDLTVVQPKELNYIDVHPTDLEGDQDFVDFERMIDNREFGVSLSTLPVDNEGDEIFLDIQVEDFSSTNGTDSLLDLVHRLAALIGVTLSHEQLKYITSHANIHTDYNIATATFSRAVGDFHTKFQQTAQSLNQAQYKLAETKYKIRIEEKRNGVFGPIYKKLLFHISALFVIVIQSALPQVILAPMQNLIKLYGVEGYPLNDSSQKPLLDYIANLLVNTVHDIKEFMFIKNTSIDTCKQTLRQNIADILSDVKNVALSEKLRQALSKYTIFKEALQKDQDTLKTYSVWTTFRPFNGMESNNIRDETGAHYIGLVQDKAQKALPLKIGVDKTPLIMNSCCIQPLNDKSNYWTFFENDSTVHEQYKRLQEIELGKHEHPRTIYLKASIKPKSINNNDIHVKVSGHIIDTPLHVYTKPHNLKTFLESNIMFDDSYLHVIANDLDNNEAWSKLSEQAHKLVVNLGNKANSNTQNPISKFIEILLAPKDDDSLFVSTLTSYLCYDLRSTFGKLACNYKVHDRWAKGKIFRPEVKLSILNSQHKSIPGDLLEKFSIMSLQPLQERMQWICLHGLNQVSELQKLIPLVDNVKLSFLLTFVLGTILNSIYDVDDVSPHMMTHVVYALVESFIIKYNNALLGKTSAELFEKQREDGKQSLIKMMEVLSKSERDMIDELKKRGLVNLKELAQNKLVTNNAIHDTQIEAIDEDEQEIIADIINYQGENGDGDDDE